MKLLIPAEVPLLLPGAREFFLEGQISGKLNESHFCKVLTDGIETSRMFVIAHGAPLRGAIGGVLFDDMATGEPCCMEYFWYVHKQERGSVGIRLLDAFEKESKNRGAVRVLMMHHVTNGSERFDHIYERRGYHLREQIFVRSL